MKTLQITRKEARGWNGTIQVGYCDLQYLLMYRQKYGYNAGVYGWNFNCYIVNGVAINTGYRGMVGKQVDYKLTREYNEKARRVQDNTKLTYKQKIAFTERLLQNYLKKAI